MVGDSKDKNKCYNLKLVETVTTKCARNKDYERYLIKLNSDHSN